MRHDLESILIPREKIAERVHELGETLSRDLLRELSAEGSDPDASGRIVLITVLVGSMIFVADLVRHMPLKLSMGLVTVSSYPGRSIASKGASIRGDLPSDLAGKHVVIVDDILDSGQTLGLIRRLIEEQRPASLRICVLLSKQVERAVSIEAEYVGFEIPDAFVVGYGLDFDGHYRNLPDIGVLRLEEGA